MGTTIFKNYQDCVSNLHKVEDMQVVRMYLQDIINQVIGIIDDQKLSKTQAKKFRDNKGNALFERGTEDFFKIKETDNRVIAMLKTVFVVNKATKLDNMKKKETHTTSSARRAAEVSLLKSRIEDMFGIINGLEEELSRCNNFGNGDKKNLKEWINTQTTISQDTKEQLIDYIDGLQPLNTYVGIKNEELAQRFDSQDEAIRIEAIREMLNMDYSTSIDFLKNRELLSRKNQLYEIKHKLLTQIIAELVTKPEEYKDIMYGFVKDDDEVPVFSVVIPKILGAMQFHIRQEDKEEILADVRILEKRYKYGKIFEGRNSNPIAKVNWCYTTDNIKDQNNLLEEFYRLREKLSKGLYNNDRGGYHGIQEMYDEDISKYIMYYYLLSGSSNETIKEKLKDIDPTKVTIEGTIKEIIPSSYIMAESDPPYEETRDSFQKRITILNRKRMNYIKKYIENSKELNIFVSSADTVDSKVSVEAIKRMAVDLGMPEDAIKVEKVKPGDEYDKTGIYINTNKKGIDMKKPNMIFLNPNEELRETSVSALLSNMGLDIPMDVIRFANRPIGFVKDESGKIIPNANMLAYRQLTGAEIYELCEDLERENKTLGDSLSDELIKKYDLQRTYELLLEEIDDVKKHMLTETIKAEGFKETLNYSTYFGDNPIAALVAYADGAEYCISIKKNNMSEGVSIAIQSNPLRAERLTKETGSETQTNSLTREDRTTRLDKKTKRKMKIEEAKKDRENRAVYDSQKQNLPIEIIRWAYDKLIEEIDAEDSDITRTTDFLIESTRVIIGGKNRDDVLLRDRQSSEDGEKFFYRKILLEIRAALEESIKREYAEKTESIIGPIVHRVSNCERIWQVAKDVCVVERENEGKDDK